MTADLTCKVQEMDQRWGEVGKDASGWIRALVFLLVPYRRPIPGCTPVSIVSFPDLSSPLDCDVLVGRDCLIHPMEGKKCCHR